jgi:ABC-type uncharacterized transport system ATPase subunit
MRDIPGVANIHDTKEGIDLALSEGADPAVVMSAAAQLVRARRVELKRVSIEDIFINLVEESGGSGEEVEHLRTELSQERVLAGAGAKP